LSKNYNKPAIFFDRDGVITISNRLNGKGFAPRNLTDFRLYEDAKPSLIKTRDAGFLNIVVSNQPDIATGLLQPSVLNEMNSILFQELALDDVFNCQHISENKCNCRKPKPGMISNAVEKFNIDLSSSWIIGDRDSDIEAGIIAGVRTIFIDRRWASENGFKADFRCESLFEAVGLILKRRLISGGKFSTDF
jgi:D-glycero-D-manno-heptose 1,7-bisphosphate phosphatase